LQERPKLLAEIEAKVLAKHGLSRGGKDAATGGAADAKANGDSKAGAAKSDTKDARPDVKDAKDAKADAKDAKLADPKHIDVIANDQSQARPRA
jgi:hypothetical protein